MHTTLAPRCLTKKSGFTLVELLVVIAIIAILASAILYAGNAAINAAKRLKSANYIQQIQTGVLNYYTEYSVYPVPTGVSGADYGISDTDNPLHVGSSNSWGSLMECLCGMIQPSTGASTGTSTSAGFTNSRAVPFLQGIKTSDVANSASGHQDAPLNALPPNSTQLYFNIMVDSAYVGVLGAGDNGTPPGGSLGLLPQFNPPTVGSTPPYTGTTTAGVALWVDCNTKNSNNSNFWRSTY